MPLSISGLSRADAAAPARRARAAGEFAVPEPPAPAAAQSAGAVAGVALAGLLLLQEQEEPAADRAARRHGKAMLRLLARMQGALLAGGMDAAALRELAALAQSVPGASHAGLHAALAAVAVRARVELARYRFE